jgi:Ca2+-binding RTX toxin-like protein
LSWAGPTCGFFRRTIATAIFTRTAAIEGTGRMATFTGTAGNDTIKGTTADDKMVGLAGNDTYVVDNCDDVVVEAPGEGTDTVLASHLFTLADDVENLTLTGTAAIDGFGNDGNNVLTGNSGPNMLTTGAGIDTVNGGDGNDVLVLGANLTAADKLDGGKGVDALRLDGDYSGGVAFLAITMVNVEQIALADGNDYKLTLVDANNASSLLVNGSLLTHDRRWCGPGAGPQELATAGLPHGKGPLCGRRRRLTLSPPAATLCP